MKKEYRRKSIKYKLFLLLTLIALAFDVILTGVSYIVYTNNMNKENERISSGLSGAIAADINAFNLESWLDGELDEDYNKTAAKIENVMKSFSDLKSIKVAKMSGSSMQIVFNFNNEGINSDYGKTVTYDANLQSLAQRLESGKYSGAVFGDRNVTSFSPIKNTSGKVLSYVMLEMSTEQMIYNRKVYVTTFSISVGIVAIIFSVLAFLYMNHILLKPINRIDSILRTFAQDNSLGEKTCDKLSKVNQHNIDEIGRMCDNFTDLINDISIKTNEVKDFDSIIIEKMQNAFND